MEFAVRCRKFPAAAAPDVKSYRFSAHYTPGHSRSEGISSDLIYLGQDRTGIVIGDVSGKGVPAALYMAELGSDMRTLAFTERCRRGSAHEAERPPAGRSRRGMFATLLYIELDATTGIMTLSNAGHLPPIIKKADGSLAKLETAGGAPLGMLPGMKLFQEEGSSSPGTR